MTLSKFKFWKEEHDFKNFPELTNRQMERFYFQSPHKQITEDFNAKVVRVIDGDTVELQTNFRDFNFPLRMLNMAAAELDEKGGLESAKWLAERLNGKEVQIVVDPKNRVEKWGRLLGHILLFGMNIGEESRMNGKAVSWEERKDGTIPNFLEEIAR
tara:strand:+ start:149 stop:619 length:471 start_codon:yes stop_codon:yes gene_type:complete